MWREDHSPSEASWILIHLPDVHQVLVVRVRLGSWAGACSPFGGKMSPLDSVILSKASAQDWLANNGWYATDIKAIWSDATGLVLQFILHIANCHCEATVCSKAAIGKARKAWVQFPTPQTGQTAGKRRADLLAAMVAAHQHIVSGGVGTPSESARRILPNMHPKIRFIAVHGGEMDIHDSFIERTVATYVLPFTLTNNNITYYQSIPISRLNESQLRTRQKLMDWHGGRGSVQRPHDEQE